MDATEVLAEAEEQRLFLIGIGSSAGGLEAIRELFATLPTDGDVAYVVVQHMSPHHKSLMAELVSRETNLSVSYVEDDQIPMAGSVYVTPPNRDVVLDAGRLRLLPASPEPASPKPSVDRFLTSLAEAFGDHAVAIILSGTGSDGAYGVQAIREAGGITIAQDSESARYDGMPMSAIQTECVDLVLRPMEIGTHLAEILASPREFLSGRREELQETPIMDLLQIVLAKTRVDFRDYKPTTVGRRIERRMVALNKTSLTDYVDFCRSSPGEVESLFKDLLISVTRFFRDPEPYDEIGAKIRDMVERRGESRLRVWVAGCATGEEAYSIAMLLAEAFESKGGKLSDYAQIIATDIDRSALNVARRGIYNISAINHIPADLAEKHVTITGDMVEVSDNIRSAILFSEHNLCQDPPFQKIDLVCCRNVLIYFGSNLQQRVLNRFHFSLRDDGILFLGSAESISGNEKLFLHKSGTANIFHKRHFSGSTQRNEIAAAYSPRPRQPAVAKIEETDRRHEILFSSLIKSISPNALLVMPDNTIGQVFGDVSLFLEMNEAKSLKMNLDLLKSPFREDAKTLVSLAMKHKERRAGLVHKFNEDARYDYQVEVYPLLDSVREERCAIVAFRQVTARAVNLEDLPEEKYHKASVQRISELEQDIASTREALQQTIEELETSNEELQSLNQELQSTNEELQATNEELETSNEELQSTNEELITVNEELQVTTSELSGRTGELSSVMESTPIAILVMDNALQVVQATNSAAQMFQLRRPLANPHVSHCVLPAAFPPLAPICNEALKLGLPLSRTIIAESNKVLINCAPYFSDQGKVLGVTMAFIDFPGMAREMDFLLNHSRHRFINRKLDGTILRISEASAKTINLPPSEAVGKNFFDLISKTAGAAIRASEKQVLETGRSGSYIRLVEDHDGTVTWVEGEEYLFDSPDQPEKSIYSVGTDVTDSVRLRERAEQLRAQIELLSDMTHWGYWSLDLTKGRPYWSREVYRIHGVDDPAYQPDLETAIDFYHPDDRADVIKAVNPETMPDDGFAFIKRLVRPDGSVVRVEARGLPIRDADGTVKEIIGVFREVGEDE